MTNISREQAIASLIRLSKHYALSDDWQNFCKEVARLIADDEKEIRFLKAMSREMMDNIPAEKIGRMVSKNF